MIENIKEKIWDLLKDKEVSLVMIFDDQGEILWHRGRRIADKRTLGRNCGYCFTPISQALRDRASCHREECSIADVGLSGSDSARLLRIKSLVILPVAGRFFLYLDSGIRQAFSSQDLAIFETLGSLLGGILHSMRTGTSSGKKISGGSPLVTGLREKIAKFAIEEEPVLLLGETGVGKSHVAEMIHTYSGRSGPLVVVNTPGIPDTLLEAQLFGHTKGAFSGAVDSGEGFVAAAEKGTLFLDEIAEVQPHLQAKLLRFIDAKMYHRLGDPREKRADVRIIAATNQDLLAAIKARTFREDLFFRLNCLAIKIPPLRERREDIAAIIEENRGLLRGKALSRQAMEILRSYDWPGNIRELLQVLKVAGIQIEAPAIREEIAGLLAFHERAEAPETGRADRAWQELKAGRSFWEAVKEPYLKRDLSRSEVQDIISRGLRECGGKYIGLLKLFNLGKEDYKPFMHFLHNNRMK